MTHGEPFPQQGRWIHEDFGVGQVLVNNKAERVIRYDSGKEVPCLGKDGHYREFFLRHRYLDGLDEWYPVGPEPARRKSIWASRDDLDRLVRAVADYEDALRVLVEKLSPQLWRIPHEDSYYVHEAFQAAKRVLREYAGEPK